MVGACFERFEGFPTRCPPIIISNMLHGIVCDWVREHEARSGKDALLEKFWVAYAGIARTVWNSA